MESERRSPDPHQADLHQAAVRPMTQEPRAGYWLLVGILTAVVALGLFAWIIQLRDGKVVGGYTKDSFWGVYIANFITIIGVSYGGAVVSAILRLTGAGWRAPLTRIAEATAVVTVFVGALCIIPSVGQPARMLEFFYRPNLSSPLIWDSLAILTYGFATLVFFYLPLIPDLVEARKTMGAKAGRLRRLLWEKLSWGWQGGKAQRHLLHRSVGLLAIMIIPLAVSVHSVLAWAFAVSSTRPWWSESLWAPYFVVAALYSGVALVILSVAMLRRMFHLEPFITERHFVRLSYILATLGALYLYLTVADFLPGAYHGQPATLAVFRALLVGSYAPWFWLVVVMGLALPLLIVAMPRTRHTGWIVFAAACINVTFWIKRVLMVVVPATYNTITGTLAPYHFTWVSVSITLGAMAAIPLLLLILFRFVPILSVTEIEEVEEKAGAVAGGGEAVGKSITAAAQAPVPAKAS